MSAMDGMLKQGLTATLFHVLRENEKALLRFDSMEHDKATLEAELGLQRLQELESVMAIYLEKAFEEMDSRMVDIILAFFRDI